MHDFTVIFFFQKIIISNRELFQPWEGYAKIRKWFQKTYWEWQREFISKIRRPNMFLKFSKRDKALGSSKHHVVKILDIFYPLAPWWTLIVNKAYVIKHQFGLSNCPRGLWMTPFNDTWNSIVFKLKYLSRWGVPLTFNL